MAWRASPAVFCCVLVGVCRPSNRDFWEHGHSTTMGLGRILTVYHSLIMLGGAQPINKNLEHLGPFGCLNSTIIDDSTAINPSDQISSEKGNTPRDVRRGWMGCTLASARRPGAQYSSGQKVGQKIDLTQCYWHEALRRAEMCRPLSRICQPAELYRA
ncbi:hypothetical protein FB45DRAFT_862277 [Roridomyces roridus]|uniref:Uncharacterized protein n=1 Tax=Roridomyces roridus TaxID=1738132 RepID=A0AAD7C6Q6_9AGAR|nr:hypothetical protein FB45DRAFT_862277 [Roridomyces roridus]